MKYFQLGNRLRSQIYPVLPANMDKTTDTHIFRTHTFYHCRVRYSEYTLSLAILPPLFTTWRPRAGTVMVSLARDAYAVGCGSGERVCV